MYSLPIPPSVGLIEFFFDPSSLLPSNELDSNCFLLRQNSQSIKFTPSKYTIKCFFQYIHQAVQPSTLTPQHTYRPQKNSVPVSSCRPLPPLPSTWEPPVCFMCLRLCLFIDSVYGIARIRRYLAFSCLASSTYHDVFRLHSPRSMCQYFPFHR